MYLLLINESPNRALGNVDSRVDNFIETLKKDKSLSPEERLWLAVLLQMLLDASGSLHGESVSMKQYCQSRAKAWLESGSRDFQCVCWNAGLEPDWVIRKLTEIEMDYLTNDNEKNLLN